MCTDQGRDTHHGQRYDTDQVLLADVDLGDAQVRHDTPRVFHLPRNQLGGGRVAGLLDFHVDLHDLVGDTAGTREEEGGQR